MGDKSRAMQKSAPVVLSQAPDIVTVCRVLQIRLDRVHHLRVLLLPLGLELWALPFTILNEDTKIPCVAASSNLCQLSVCPLTVSVQPVFKPTFCKLLACAHFSSGSDSTPIAAYDGNSF